MAFGESGCARISGQILENMKLTKGGWVLYLCHSKFGVIILYIYLIHMCIIYLFLL